MSDVWLVPFPSSRRPNHHSGNPGATLLVAGMADVPPNNGPARLNTTRRRQLVLPARLIPDEHAAPILTPVTSKGDFAS
jgi:hypothetical protein